MGALHAGKHVFAVGLFSFGEQVIGGGEHHPYFMEAVCAGGDRPLGICTAQLLAALEWARSQTEARSLDIVAQGLSTGLIALCAAALRPRGIGTMNLDVPDSLRRLIDRHIQYNDQPVMFCFGLLEQFDIEDLVALSDPVQIEIAGRGPMR